MGELAALMPKVLADVEQADIRQPREDSNVMAWRVRAYTVYKLGPTAAKTIADLLGVILALLVGSTFPKLAYTWVGFKLIEIVQHVLNGFEQVEDPVERDVFEAIFELRNKLSIANYDAIREQDFEKGYARISPTFEEICEALPNHHADAVRAALTRMKARRIIGTYGDRWQIRL